uniref:Uncharacterized protein n=1 Tax=Klebsiella pneumoniae TaxID=573 RepID=A0A2R4NFY7_KLEPN|nr:hypothetical protein [Klebsiella pneumoniae]
MLMDFIVLPTFFKVLPLLPTIMLTTLLSDLVLPWSSF